MTTYQFSLSYFGDFPTTVPTLQTGCINTRIDDIIESFHCGDGSVQLEAITPPGVILSWRDLSNTELFRGHIFNTPVLSATTTYRAVPLRVYGNNQECFGLPEDATATIYPKPTVEIGSDTAICDGQSKVFTTVPSNFRNYLWSTNQTTGSITGRTEGKYYVTVTDQNNCTASESLFLTVHPTPEVDLGPDTAICTGETIILDADPFNNGYNVLWNDNTTAAQKMVLTGGDYAVQVSNAFNCSASDQIKVTLKDKPICDGINVLYQFNNTYFFSVKSPQYFNKIIWDLGDGSPAVEAPTVTHTYNDGKLYQVKVTLTTTCTKGNDTTFVHTLDALSLPQLQNNTFKIYPNPAQDEITITSDDVVINNIQLTDVVGKVITIPNQRINAYKWKINSSNLSAGLYLIQVFTDKGVQQSKIEILK